METEYVNVNISFKTEAYFNKTLKVRKDLIDKFEGKNHVTINGDKELHEFLMSETNDGNLVSIWNDETSLNFDCVSNDSDIEEIQVDQLSVNFPFNQERGPYFK